MSGFYLMHREWQQNPVFGNDMFSRRDAWVWMIERAVFQECRVGVSGKAVTLRRGQFVYSIRYLADAWRWHRASVERFFAKLKTETMIETETEHGVTVVTVCNYDIYQAQATPPETPAETATETTPRQERDRSETNKKEDKELKEKKDSPLVDADFETFWHSYPRRMAKGQAVKAWRTSLKKALPALIISGAKRYAAENVGTDPKFLKHPATWLNAECWMDETSPQPEPETTYGRAWA